MSSFPNTASINPSFAVVWHQGLSSISCTMASAKHDDHSLRGNAATTLAIVDLEMRWGLRPTLSVGIRVSTGDEGARRGTEK
jgi:hypothetical protein